MYFHYFENLDYTDAHIVYLREGDIDWSFENPYIFPVEDIEAPQYDTGTEYLVDVMPERRADGTWLRRIEVRQYTSEELDARKEFIKKHKSFFKFMPNGSIPKEII